MSLSLLFNYLVRFVFRLIYICWKFLFYIVLGVLKEQEMRVIKISVILFIQQKKIVKQF